MEGSATLNGDTSFVRVILQNETGFQYMVFETYALICPNLWMPVKEYCDETCALDQIKPISLIIQVIDAKIDIESLYYSDQAKENAEQLRYEAKRAKDAEKIEIMNEQILIYGMNWVAGDNSLVGLYYDEKKNLFGENYNTLGYEYYQSGVFEFLGHGEYQKADPDLVKEFDWRNRHGANDPNSDYWDGDYLGTGWLTSVKHQHNSKGCYAFAAIGVTEALANISTVNHYDFDLSEPYLLTCFDLGSNSGKALDTIKDVGCITEYCFPFDTNSMSCIDKCLSPDSIFKIKDTLIIDHSNIESIRLALINQGPLSFSYIPSGNPGGHAVTLSGYQFNNQDSTINWIIKDSYGLNPGINGFRIMKVDNISRVIAATKPVYLNDIALPDTCYDMDLDGFYYWGVGEKPINCDCEEEIEDCDDDDRFVGGYDANYNCPCLLEFFSNIHHISRDTLSINSIIEETYKYRTGIYAIGSQFYVEDACLSQSVPCSQFKTSHFHGLNYGIYALGIDGSKTVSIQKTYFDQNKTGIYLSAIPDAIIVHDTFEIVKEKTNSIDTLCGLYLDNCSGYQVEENNFKGDYYYNGIWGTCHKRVGIVINNSGEEYNKIYNNTLDSLFIGTLAMNINRNSKDKMIGLQILCNDYDSSFYDIAVTAQEHQDESGIADPQGSSAPFPTSPANNTFSYTWHNPESDYANDCQSIVYWHLKDTTTANTKPKYHSKPEVEPLYNEDYNQEYLKDSCCPSSFTSGGGGGSIEEFRLKINEYSIKSDSVRSILELLVDGGDTYQLTMDVQNSIPENAEETAEMLLINSPYLSDSVMLVAITQETVLTPAMITSVLFENPQAAKTDTIQQALDNRVQLLTDEQRTFIDQGWYTIGAKEMLEANYAHYFREKTEAINSLIRYFKTDTLILNPFDSIINLYLEDNSIYSKYSLAFEYLNRGDTLNVWDLLSSIPANFNMTDAEMLQYQQYVDFFDALISSGIYQGYNEIDTSLQESLFSMASSTEGEIKTLTRNILLSENLISYNEPFIFPDQNLKSTKYKKHNSILTIADNSLKLYPNPALNYVIVDYSVAESASNQSIKILDISGRMCYDIAYLEPRGYMIIPLKDLSNGIYIFQLCQNRLPVISKKLIISK